MTLARTKIFLFTPALNAGNSISDALRSVAKNLDDHLDVTVFFADGGSSDDTVQKATSFPFVNRVPGTDKDLYEGLNRALDKAVETTGADPLVESSSIICGFLNADDVIPDGALLQIAQAAQTNRSVQMFSGEVMFEDQGASSSRLKHNRPMSLTGCLFGIPVINARFFRLSCLELLCGFRPQAGLAADRDLLIRFLRQGLESMHVNAHTYTYRHNAGSKTLARDGAARDRIWRAERDLADFLATSPDTTAREAVLSRRSAVISDLRRSLHAWNNFPNAWSFFRYGLVGLRDFVRWRGKSSGY